MITDLPQYLKRIVPHGHKRRRRKHNPQASDATLVEGEPGPALYSRNKRFADNDGISKLNKYSTIRYRPRPYIGLKARLSQIWINKWTVMVILVIVKLLLFQQSVQYSLNSALTYSNSLCESTQSLLSNAVSAPHYLAATANSLIETGMNDAISGLINMLMLIITGVENLIIFALDMTIGTYACLTIAVIDAAAGTAINATESIISFANSSLSTITNDLEKGLNEISDVINGVDGLLSDVANLITNGNSQIGTVNLTIDSLKNFTIPSSINTELTNLQQNLPTYDSVKNATEQLIKSPFDSLKNQLNSSLAAFAFNSSALNVPSVQTMNICNNNGELFDALQQAIQLATKVILALLSIAAVLICAPVAYQEIIQWRWLKQCAKQEQVHGSFPEDKELEIMTALQAAQSHMKVRVQNFVSKRLDGDSDRILAKWWVDYITYQPALLCLELALCGIMVVILQYIMLLQVKKYLPALEQQSAQNLNDILTILTDSAIGWANNTNAQINSTESNINNNLFGWVQTSTLSVNNTLYSFASSMNSTIAQDFQGTPLYSPVSSIMQCVIGSKLQEAEQGLTWIHNNAKVSLPRVNETILLAATNSSTPGMNVQSITNSTVTVLSSTLQVLYDTYAKSVYLELYISVVLLCIWLVVAGAGFGYCYWVHNHVQASKQQSNIKMTDLSKLPQFKPPPRKLFSSVEDDWSLNSFQPPSLLTEPSQHTQKSHAVSILGSNESVYDDNGTNLESVYELKPAAMQKAKLREPPFTRASAKGYPDFI